MVSAETSTESSTPHSRFARWQEAERKANTWWSKGLMSLPRELRDQIYCYLVPHENIVEVPIIRNQYKNVDTVRAVVLRGTLALLSRAYPRLHEEIREVYFRESTFRLTATRSDRDHWTVFRDWLQLEGPRLTMSMQRLQVKCHFGFFNNTRLFDISPNRDGTLTVKLSGYIAPKCVCLIQEKVHTSLSQDDAMNDPFWVARLEESADYGLVFQFALHLLEATRIQQDGQRRTPGARYYPWYEVPCAVCGQGP